MRYLPTLLLFVAVASAADIRDFSTWTEYEGGADSSQYSSLKQINKNNVSQLQVAWTYATGENGNYSFSPIVVDGVMYVLARNNSFVALDAATGKELWVRVRFQAQIQKLIQVPIQFPRVAVYKRLSQSRFQDE